MAIKKPPGNETEGRVPCDFCARLYVSEDFLFTLVNDVLDLSHGEVKLFSQWFVTNAVNKTPFYNGPVALRFVSNDPFVNQALKFRP